MLQALGEQVARDAEVSGELVEAHDLDALMATLAPDVVFHSPLSARAAFRGHEQVRELFGVALPALSDLRYHTDVGDDRTRVIVATARVNGEELEESALIRLDEQARITEVTLWIRPLPALTAMMAALGPGLARAAGKPGLALLVGAATKPLVLMTRTGDRTLVPLISGPRTGCPFRRNDPPDALVTESAIGSPRMGESHHGIKR